MEGIQMKKQVVESSAITVLDLNDKLRVLHVDDDSGLLKITKQCLEMEGAIQVDTALSVEEALMKLEKENYDVVVSDYQMPEKDGLDFLKILRTKGNAIPFIMFTGKGREEVAIKALNLGANQYLNKVGETETVYVELAHNITELAKTRKAEERQCESEEKFKELFEKANDGLVFVDLSGRIVDVNQKAAEIAEKRKEAIVGKSFLDIGLVGINDVHILVEKLGQQAMGKSTERFEFEIENDKGEKKFVEVSSTLIRKNDVPTGSLAIVRDVTERKKAEKELRESGAKYRILVEQSLQGIVIAQGFPPRLVFANSAMAAITGYSLDELTSFSPKQIEDLVHPDDRALFFGRFKDRLQGKPAPSQHEIRGIRKDGTVFWIEMSGCRIEYNGQPAVQAAFIDITERKKVELELFGRQRMLENVLSASPEAIVVIDMNGKIIENNEQARKMFGYSSEDEVRGRSGLDFIAERDRERIMEDIQKTLKQGLLRDIEYAIVTKDGRERLARISSSVVKDAVGNPANLVIIMEDITERKKSEEVVRKSEERYRELANSLPEIVFETDITGKITFFSQRALDITGFTREELESGLNMLSFVFPAERERAAASIKKSMTGENFGYNEYTLLRKDGTTFPAFVTTSPIISQNKATGLRGLVIDITERKKNEELVSESQQRFRGLFMGNPEAAAYVGPDYRVLEINPRFEELFGYSLEEIKGKHINDVVVPKSDMDEAEALDRKALGGYVYHNTKRRRKDGSLVSVAVSAAPIVAEGKPVGFVAMYKDISDLKDAEKRLESMNEKLQVVGGLTRHDVRNKLGVLTGNAFLLKKKYADHMDIVGGLKDMEQACTEIVRIFDFAKMYEMLGVEDLTCIDVEKTFSEAASLFSGLINLKVVNDCHGLTVLADSLLRQLFYNLIDNSLKYGKKSLR